MIDETIYDYMDGMTLRSIDENKIKCTIKRSFIEKYQLKISELAYGTESAKKLFRLIMKRAYKSLNFKSEDIPLMIDAEPINKDTIALIISIVKNESQINSNYTKFPPCN